MQLNIRQSQTDYKIQFYLEIDKSDLLREEIAQQILRQFTDQVAVDLALILQSEIAEAIKKEDLIELVKEKVAEHFADKMLKTI